MIHGLKGSTRRNAINEFKRIVGSIVILTNPLAAASQANLLGISTECVSNRLQLLHSVLDIPPNTTAPMRIFHESFRDFLICPYPEDIHKFSIDEKTTHKTLVVACLRLLSESGHLKEDICELGVPGKPRNAVDQQTIDQYLPSEVRYACLYWVHHLKGQQSQASQRPPSASIPSASLPPLARSFEPHGEDFGGLLAQVCLSSWLGHWRRFHDPFGSRRKPISKSKCAHQWNVEKKVQKAALRGKTWMKKPLFSSASSHIQEIMIAQNLTQKKGRTRHYPYRRQRTLIIALIIHSLPYSVAIATPIFVYSTLVLIP
jgi:hypothetical protein